MQHPRGIWFLACLSGLAIVVGCTGTSTSDVPSAETSLVASASPSPAAPVTMGNGAVALEPLETFTMSLPQDLVIASGSVWTTNEAVNTVSRIDTASGKVQAIDLRPGFDPQRLELAAGGIWTTGAGEDGSAGGLARIDPATQKIEYFLRGRFGELAYAFGSLWVAGRGHLVRVDPVTGRAIGATITSNDPGYCLVSAGAGSVWLGCGRTLDRVDPSTNKIVATVRDIGAQPAVIAVRNEVWVKTGLDPFVAPSIDRASATLVRINPNTTRPIPGTVVHLVHGASVAGASALANGDVIWLPTTFGAGPGVGMLLEFDPRTGRVVKRFDLSEGRGYGSNAIAFGYGSLWTASGTANEVRRFLIPPS